jgi:hypothetical protein
MKYLDASQFDFNIANKNLPVNIYALRLLDNDKNSIYDIIINHDGCCPNTVSERDQSNFNDYLSNLESEVIGEFFKLNKIKKPKNYFHLFELITDSNGELYHFSKLVN